MDFKACRVAQNAKNTPFQTGAQRLTAGDVTNAHVRLLRSRMLLLALGLSAASSLAIAAPKSLPPLLLSCTAQPMYLRMQHLSL